MIGSLEEEIVIGSAVVEKFVIGSLEEEIVIGSAVVEKFVIKRKKPL